LLNSRDKNDKTPLHYAATKGNLQVRTCAQGNSIGIYMFSDILKDIREFNCMTFTADGRRQTAKMTIKIRKKMSPIANTSIVTPFSV